MGGPSGFVTQSAEKSATMPVREDLDGPYRAYNLNMKAPIFTQVNRNPRARVHSREWRKVLAGDPVEINPSNGFGLKVMTIDEWTSRWKRNDDFPDCLCCGGMNTLEHHFTANMARDAFTWESEAFCRDCHMWSYRSYHDPNYFDKWEYEKHQWQKLVMEQPAPAATMPAEA